MKAYKIRNRLEFDLVVKINPKWGRLSGFVDNEGVADKKWPVWIDQAGEWNSRWHEGWGLQSENELSINIMKDYIKLL